MRRFVGTALIGLGVLLLVVAVGLPFYVAPAVTRLPYDMQLCPAANEVQPEGCLKPSVAEAAGATFLQIKEGQLAIQQGTLRSTTWVRPQAKTTADWQATGEANRLGGNTVVWGVSSETRWVESGDALISAYTTELALDRVSGAAVPWDAQWLDDSALGDRVPRRNVEYKGQVYKFPFGTERRDYEIFDSNMREALPANFVEVTTVGDMEAYHFKQEITRKDAQNVSPASLAVALSKFAPTATAGKVVYSNIREVWVDPVTGAYLNVREQQTKELVPNDGSDGPTILLSADFRYTNETITNAVKSAQNNHSRLRLVSLYGPIGFGVLGALFVIGGLLLALRRGPMPTDSELGAWDETLPKPRHRLRGEGGGPEDTDGPLTDTIPGATPTWSGPPR
jgi:hypothetical protein